jgi:5-dehydro-2-deoxygluconokinase
MRAGPPKATPGGKSARRGLPQRDRPRPHNEVETGRAAPKAGHLMARPARNRFLIIGRAGMDLYADPPGTPIETATRFTTALGGSSANIAVALTRAGGRAALLTCVSDDAVGRFCLANWTLTAWTAPMSRRDRGRGAQFAGRGRNAGRKLPIGHLPQQRRRFRDDHRRRRSRRFPAFRRLITTGTVLAAGAVSRTATFRAFDLARAAGLPLIFDIDYRPYSWPSAARPLRSTRAPQRCVM